ncbi:MAG TPA: flagellar biosynthesis protein FlhB [Geobacteraceae bacterium]|nr:flagellar biosynthesis protein FlhB [Geobacteraceae bacterium]
MAESDKHSKTEQPTAKKLEEARKKGPPPLSRDMTSTVTLLVSMVTLYTLGSYMLMSLKENTRSLLGGMGSISITPSGVYSLLLQQLYSIGAVIAPFMIMVMVAGIVAVVIQGGVSFSSEKLSLKFDKLNPIEGVKRLFKKEAAVEALKSILKILIVGYIAYRVLRDEMDAIYYLTETDIRGIFEFISHLSFKIVIHTCGVMIVLSVLDLAFVKWSHLQNLKMTKEEVKQEHKDSEGDPHLKGKIRKMRYEKAFRRLRLIIPTADVVVTNPTHFAVALKYDREKMAAPIVIAKGADHLALRIKAMARENNVMLVENRFLARELYAQVKEGEEIPESLYVAVAELLAYVYGLKGKKL